MDISTTTNTAPNNPHNPPNFLSLPLELRLEIYSYIIPRRQILECDRPGFSAHAPTGRHLYSQSLKVLHNADADFRQNAASWRDPRDDPVWDSHHNRSARKQYRKRYPRVASIFRVCRQVSHEALGVLYGDNIFVVRLNNGGEHALQKTYSKCYRDRIRYVLVVAQYRAVLYGRGSKPDVQLWSELLPHVRGLRILTKRPVRSRYTQIGRSDETKIAEWVKWLRPFLQCFKEYLPKHATVVVDDLGKVEDGEIVQEYFSAGR